MTTQDLAPLQQGRVLHHARLRMTRRLLDAIRATPRTDDISYARALAEHVVTEAEPPAPHKISEATFERGLRAMSLAKNSRYSLLLALEAMGLEVDE